MKTISITTQCFNEEENVEILYERVRIQMAKIGKYKYEHIFIDNHSTDRTVEILKRIAAADPNVRIIVNARNFGQIRSPMHASLQARGDAVIGIVSDLQDPPEMIPDFIREWENGYLMVLATKTASHEHTLLYWMRTQYYKMINRMADAPTFENVTGFGIYDKRVMDTVRSLKDPYPYFRGLIADLGFSYKLIPYTQPRRSRGVTKNNFYTLYDMAMLGIVNLSKVPLRLATMAGFLFSIISFFVATGYLLYKLLFWHSFDVGIAPLVIGLFFLGSIQLLSLGILGEYVGAIYTHVRQHPYVIEQERVNFENELGAPRQTPIRLSEEPAPTGEAR
ncbi:MAG: glycosyltransferase family 2 protein [Capsulimonadaceae bacterium]|nr:glycosyltransferase family 2 protein [Capsulimonadaceae bacterium]